ncbi:MAG TPA: AtpZ/AtpI family protein [Actinomycetota bacterium]|nr:AtpZ/AtpI family protein [Actinomycetota bacterium]
MSEKPSQRGGWKSDAASMMSLGFEFAGAVLLFWFLGRLVDGWLGTEPWVQLAGAILGWIGGTIHVVVAVQRRNG